jgi:hypothetical protein
MDPRLTRVSMTALANHLAGNRLLQPTTDETIDHLAVSNLAPERLAELLLGDVKLIEGGRSEGEVERAFAMLAIETVVPKNLGAVPVKKIINLRKRFARERGKFQEMAIALAKKHADLQGGRGIEEHIRAEIDKSIKPELEKLKEALRASEIDVAIGSMNLKFELPLLGSALAIHGLPAAGALGAAPVLAPLVAAAPVAAPIVAGAGIAFWIARVLRDGQKGRDQALAASPVSYLLRVEEALAPGYLSSWVRRDAYRSRIVH